MIETARKKHIVNKAGREKLSKGEGNMATDIDQRLIDIQREYVDFLDDGVSADLFTGLQPWINIIQRNVKFPVYKSLK